MGQLVEPDRIKNCALTLPVQPIGRQQPSRLVQVAEQDIRRVQEPTDGLGRRRRGKATFVRTDHGAHAVVAVQDRAHDASPVPRAPGRRFLRMDGLSFDSGLWGLVGWASLIATALATGTSTLAALWWRREDRRFPSWTFVSAYATWYAHPHRPLRAVTEEPFLLARLANSGEGTGYSVGVSGYRCRAEICDDRVRPSRYGGRVAAIATGEDVQLAVNCSGAEWDEAAVIIEWVKSPTWKKKTRRDWIWLTDLAPRPEIAWEPGSRPSEELPQRPAEPAAQRRPATPTAPWRRTWRRVQATRRLRR